MWEGESLLDLAILITVWVLAIQYFVNFFVRSWLKGLYYPDKLVEAEADEKVESFERILRIAIAFALCVAVVLGTIGWIAS